MPKGGNNMDNKSYEQFLIIQAKFYAYKQETNEKLTQITEDPKVLTETFTSMIDQTNNYKLSPAHKDTSNSTKPTTVVPSKRRAPPLDGGHYTKIGGMWNLKHDISSPKFYELLIKKEPKVDTALDLKNFYNQINMCLNEVTRLREDLFPGYQSIKRHY